MENEWCGIGGWGWRIQQVDPEKKTTEKVIVSSYTEIIKSRPRYLVEETTTMETESWNKWKGWREGLNSVKGSIVDFKIHLQKVFEVVCSSERQN